MPSLKLMLGVAVLSVLTACGNAQNQADNTTQNSKHTAHDSTHHQHSPTNHSQTDDALSPHSKAYLEDQSHIEMIEAMREPNPDIAFAKAMIAHHKGAVHMAKVQLEYGKDETMNKLAQDIINAQETEITLMENWLKAHKQ